MAKMFGILRSPSPDGDRGGKATRLGDTTLVAELNNTGRSRDGEPGKTTARLTLHADGSGSITIDREGNLRMRYLFSTDDEPLGLMSDHPGVSK